MSMSLIGMGLIFIGAICMVYDHSQESVKDKVELSAMGDQLKQLKAAADVANSSSRIYRDDVVDLANKYSKLATQLDVLAEAQPKANLFNQFPKQMKVQITNATPIPFEVINKAQGIKGVVKEAKKNLVKSKTSK